MANKTYFVPPSSLQLVSDTRVPILITRDLQQYFKTCAFFFFFADIPAQVPPLTPGTNKKMTEALKASFASWEKEQLKLNIVKGKKFSSFFSFPYGGDKNVSMAENNYEVMRQEVEPSMATMV